MAGCNFIANLVIFTPILKRVICRDGKHEMH